MTKNPKFLLKPLLVIFCFTLGFSHVSYGQGFELSGEVKDQYQEPVAFASVFLLTVTDSTLVTGTSADENGAFLFSNIAEGLYFLKASYIGQVSENLPLEILKDTLSVLYFLS